MKWELVKVSDVSCQIRGVSYKPEQVSDTEKKGYSPILRANNITDAGLHFEDLVFVKADVISTKQYLKKGDIVIAASSGSKHIVGKANLYRGDRIISFGAFCKVVRPKPHINPCFLGYYFASDNYRKKISALSAGANINNIRGEHIDNLEIPLPPLPVQERIAAILDEADALRKKDAALLKKYDELLQSIFYDMFGDPLKNEKGWEEVTLDYVCSDIVDCPHTTPNHIENISEYPCIRTSEISNGFIDWSSMKYLNKAGYELRTKRIRPQQGDLIYSREGTFGDAVIVPKENNFSLGQRTMLLRPNTEFVNSVFLWAMVRSTKVYRQALRMNNGSTVGHVNVKDIRKFEVLLPPKALQNSFSAAVELLFSQRENMFTQQAQSESLFHSLMQRAFKGELVW